MKYILSFLMLAFVPFSMFAQDATTYTYRVGQIEVSLLNENQGQGNESILLGHTPEILKETIPAGTFPNAVNAFLIKNEGKYILADTGFGRKLFDNLAASGVSPEKIDIVLLTHMHGDHIGGMFKDGTKAFPNSKVYIAKAEYDYWSSGEKANETANKIFTQYKEQLVIFDPVEFNAEQNLLTGIKAIKAYGHTPGHTLFLIESGREQLLIWGDITHAQVVQIPYPAVAVTYDVDPTQAIASRKAVLKYVAEKNIPVAGMHIPYPGIGKITTGNGDGYIYTPITEPDSF